MDIFQSSLEVISSGQFAETITERISASFESSVFALLNDSVTEWKAETKLQFKKTTSTDAVYLFFQKYLKDYSLKNETADANAYDVGSAQEGVVAVAKLADVFELTKTDVTKKKF